MLLVHTDDSYGTEGAAAVAAGGGGGGVCFSKINISAAFIASESHSKELARRVIEHSANGIIYFGQERPGRIFYFLNGVGEGEEMPPSFAESITLASIVARTRNDNSFVQMNI